jgi:hypothetical protein
MKQGRHRDCFADLITLNQATFIFTISNVCKHTRYGSVHKFQFASVGTQVESAPCVFRFRITHVYVCSM